MAALIYSLCALTALTCAFLLTRAYLRSRYRILLWGGLAFVGLTIGNVVLVADKIFLTHVDLSTLRYAITLAAMCILFFGLIWDTE